jgi:hypothetical protein
MQEPKRFNKDWTIRERRSPRKNEVVIDPDGNFGVVTRTEGDIRKRFLWIDDRKGQECYTREDPDSFTLANAEQTRDFYFDYKRETGWRKGRILKLAGKDYPLQLVTMEYDLMHQEMLYVFKDFFSPDKYFKTLNESIVEFLPSWEEDILDTCFSDPQTRLSHEVEISIRENPLFANGWNVSGRSFSFQSREHANVEIQRWIDSMRIRRVCSVLSKNAPGIKSQIVLENKNLCIREWKENVGQPFFVSHCAAAQALVFLGEDAWNRYLSPTLDEYDI